MNVESDFVKNFTFSAIPLPRKGTNMGFEDFHGPTFVQEPPTSIDFSNNTGAKLDCVARGNPAPVVQWVLLDGKRVRNVGNVRHVFENGTLYFPPFRTQEYQQDVHAAIYRCQAVNVVGTIVSRDVIDMRNRIPLETTACRIIVSLTRLPDKVSITFYSTDSNFTACWKNDQLSSCRRLDLPLPACRCFRRMDLISN
uniref:Ig-like domain-containing protein n=1 Tax=Strigamia maritima TaxID=126957 RepID=T1JHN6_STRMM